MLLADELKAIGFDNDLAWKVADLAVMASTADCPRIDGDVLLKHIGDALLSGTVVGRVIIELEPHMPRERANNGN
jgi:hypothetical protein